MPHAQCDLAMVNDRHGGCCQRGTSTHMNSQHSLLQKKSGMMSATCRQTGSQPDGGPVQALGNRYMEYLPGVAQGRPRTMLKLWKVRAPQLLLTRHFK